MTKVNRTTETDYEEVNRVRVSYYSVYSDDDDKLTVEGGVDDVSEGNAYKYKVRFETDDGRRLEAVYRDRPSSTRVYTRETWGQSRRRIGRSSGESIEFLAD